VIVGENASLLSSDEVAILTRGPKFSVRRVLNKERFLVELEKAYIKIRWALRDAETEEVDLVGVNTEDLETVENLAEIEAAKSRTVFDQDELSMDLRKQRATVAKHNTRVILPGPLSTAQEQELVMRRVEWEAVYDEYVREFCDEEGVQESNLTDQERRGLKSLQKRVADGSLVICETDKSSRFAVMSREEYIEAGKKHVDKDMEVDMDFMVKNQRRINGHMSMIMKTFRVGEEWNHQARLRATKLTYSLSVAPLYLLYKDHKGWSLAVGGAPPSRPVASSGGGQNDHMSESVSQILEPVANTYTGGMEVNSTPDFVSVIVSLNGKDLVCENLDLEEIDRELNNELEAEAEKSVDVNSSQLEDTDMVSIHQEGNQDESTTGQDDIDCDELHSQVSRTQQEKPERDISNNNDNTTQETEEQWQGEEYGFEVGNNDFVLCNDTTRTSADNL
jgi:hypothetical protein